MRRSYIWGRRAPPWTRARWRWLRAARASPRDVADNSIGGPLSGAAAPLAKSLPGLTPLDTGSFDNWSAGASLGATL